MIVYNTAILLVLDHERPLEGRRPSVLKFLSSRLNFELNRLTRECDDTACGYCFPCQVLNGTQVYFSEPLQTPHPSPSC